MVMADAVIHFRFKNEKDSDVKKFPFAGAATTVRELKDYITQKHRLDNPSTRPDKRQAPSELSIENLETGLVYISDETDIPNGTTVIVSRKLAGGEGSSSDVAAQAAAAAVEQQQPASDSSPASSQSQLAKPPVPRKVIKRTGSDLNEAYFYKDSDAAVNGGLATGGLSDPKWVELGFVGKIKQDTNLSECTWLLEKNQSYALQYQCLLYYDHTVYVHRASRASSTAYCTKCQVKGHWANACTAAMDYNSPVGGGMHRRNGGVRAPTVLASTVTTNPQAYASVPVDSGEYEDIPPELRCGICQGLIRDAVTMPCCDKSFCDSCVQNLLISDTGSVCPNCKAEVQLDSCTANSLLRDSVAKWEREMQVKRQKRKDDVLSAGRSASDGIKKEPTTSPANAAHPLNHGGTRPNFYNRNQAMSTNRSEGGNQQFVRGQQQNDGPRSANEPMRIGSVLGRSNPSSVTASMFQQPPQQQQQQQRIPSSGGFPLASTNFMGNTVQQRLRGDIRPPANPMPFFPPPFSDFSGFMGAAGFPMDPSSFTAMRRLPSHAAYMARMGYGAFMGVPGGAQSVAMQQQLQRSLAAQAQQQQQQQGGGVSSLPNLRITRTPNQQPKVPVQSPFDSSSSSQDRRSSPDKPSSRSDDYRDKDRRDKEDDRRRGGDDRSKYDDRDRRSGEKRRSSHDDRRSPDQRSRRDVSPRDRSSKRPRVDSPDRRSDVKKESSGGSSSLSSRMDGGSKQAMEKERERSRKEITPPSKVASSSRAMEKEVLRDVKSEKPDNRSVRLRELEPLRPEEKETRPKLQQPDESREVRIKQEEKETSTRPKASEEKVAVKSPAPPSAKVKIEAPSSTPPPSSTAARPTIRKDTGSFFKDAAGRTERAAPTKTSEQPVSAAAPKKDSPPPAVRVLIRAPSPGLVTVPVKTSTSTTEEQGNASDHSDTAVKERSGESKKERSSKKDKSSRSSRKDKDRKPSKSSREKRARSASSEKRSTKRRSDKKRSAPEDDGVFLGHIQHPDGVEVDDGTAGEHRDEQQPPVRSEKRSHKSSRSSRKDKESKSSRNRSPSRESRKRESRRNSENDEMSSVNNNKGIPNSEQQPDKERSKKERSKKSSHKSSKSSRNKEKYSKSSNEKTADGDAVDSASSSLRKDKTVQDARVMLDEKRRQDSSAGRLNGDGRGSDRDSQEYERISSRKSDQAGSGDADEDAGGGGKSSKSTRHKSKSKKDKSSKSSRGEKHSSRSSPSGEKRHKKKKHRRDKRETGDGGRSPAGDDDDRQE